MTEQKYQAILAVFGDGRTVAEVAAQWKVGSNGTDARTWKRWERGQPFELWQMDTVGGFLLADGNRRQGADRDRRPLSVLRLGQTDAEGAYAAGLRRLRGRAEGVWSVPEQV